MFKLLKRNLNWMKIKQSIKSSGEVYVPEVQIGRQWILLTAFSGAVWYDLRQSRIQPLVGCHCFTLDTRRSGYGASIEGLLLLLSPLPHSALKTHSRTIKPCLCVSKSLSQAHFVIYLFNFNWFIIWNISYRSIKVVWLGKQYNTKRF